MKPETKPPAESRADRKWLKHLLYNHKALSLDSQSPHEKAAGGQAWRLPVTPV